MADLPVSPLAPASFPDLPEIGGLRLATTAAGVRYSGRTDVMLAVLDPGTSIAGVFTQSATRSAPVLDCQEKLGGDPASGAAMLVNSGNANAFTGSAGSGSVGRICAAVAEVANVPAERVFTASTGVIGEVLPDDRITAKLAELNDNLTAGALHDAAEAIRTTDTYAKASTSTIEVDGKPVTIAGIAKGSGMIAPDMATMLVFIFTDALLDQTEAQTLVSQLNDQTFNCITVDSDTSTSDSLLLACTGASGVDVAGKTAFANALHDIMLDLAHQVVRDGEGATKFVEIQVQGAASPDDAKKAGLAIANSPLVKTAIAGEDPNWGRIVMAIGKSGAAADRDKLGIWFGDILVAEQGWVAESYSEEAGAAYMKQSDLVIRCDLGIGDGNATVWTCDLTHGYISINADYRS
ncbi:bifunctional glutamate N-acetyltransferase/amino-acid acetyltransferase ArgJ [Shimia ponticola]|uniref:bifunctional glutamate N-acetyltransferase/amino-acid acetyltransferase ArgJ n=1 Tax=Shimia ponticola TaxID=2582893 RepID=UPI0011BD8F98|nr:bifunctional glutamate N-acetyltransferase/amino-acid acetyltransferase ArgJ [Shimia ponticola]